jgi:hypothetical protein
MAARPEFKRALLGLHLDAHDRKAIDVAVGLAGLLGLELVGIFATDEALRELASYPGAREFVPAGRVWRPIDIDKMIHEQMLTARAAQRAFDELASASGVSATFQIASGSEAQKFVSMSCASDILVVTEPTQASALATHSFSLFFDAAMRSPASVLLVPRSVRRRRGPIVAIAGAPDDPGISVASAIAATTRQELVLIEAYNQGHRAPPASRRRGRELPAGCSPHRGTAYRGVTRKWQRKPHRHHARGVAATNIGLAIAEARRVPVLILSRRSRDCSSKRPGRQARRLLAWQ